METSILEFLNAMIEGISAGSEDMFNFFFNCLNMNIMISNMDQHYLDSKETFEEINEEELIKYKLTRVGTSWTAALGDEGEVTEDDIRKEHEEEKKAEMEANSERITLYYSFLAALIERAPKRSDFPT